MTRYREPHALEEYVIWLLEEWAAEMPTTIHKDEVFFGPPDRPNARTKLGADQSTADELVGGSLLGSLAYQDETRKLVEEDNPHHQQPSVYEGSLSIDRHLATPLRSAMRRCGRFTESYLAEVARFGGDWLTPAQRRGCYSTDIAKVYAEEALRRLWRQYQPDMPARVDRAGRRTHYSDDVPWTELSESAQRAIVDGENNGGKAA